MPRKERFKAKDKITHKMTRYGLVERNETTGEQSKVSQRGQDFDLQAQRRDAISARVGLTPSSAHQPRSTRPVEPGNGASVMPQQPIDTPYNSPASDRYESRLGSQRRQRQTQVYQPDSAHRAEDNSRPCENIPDSRQNATSPSYEAAQYAAPIDSPEPLAENPFYIVQGTADAEKSGHLERLRFNEAEQPSPVSHRKRSTQYQRKFAADAAKSDQIPHMPDVPGNIQASKTGKLQFAPNDLPPDPPGSKLANARRKVEQMDAKLQKARGKVPAKRRVRLERSFNEETGKSTRRLRIEKEVKSQRDHIKGPVPLRPIKSGANLAVGYAHRKLYQAEQENVGVEAAHKTEIAAEGLTRTALRFNKTRPYRRVAKLECKMAKANVNLAYRQALEDNPKLKSNALSRYMQKQKIKRQYTKAAREARKAAKRTKKGGDLIGSAAKTVTDFVRKHPIVSVIIALLMPFVIIFSGIFSSCSNLAGGSLSSAVLSSYTAKDRDIDEAELAYTEWEADLQLEIDHAEQTHPGYDEYRYSIDDIGHNPFELMAYLTAVHYDFKFADIQAELRAIFDEQYTLEFVPEVEIRYRTETRTSSYTDSEGNSHSYTYTVEVPYEWHILNINLTSLSFTDLILPRMNASQREMYGVYMDTLGNRQYLINPFEFDWLPYVSAYYGWRVHPLTGQKDFNRGIDIDVPSGTNIIAGHDGVVASAGSAGEYGPTVVLDNGKGLQSKYAYCSAILVSVGQEVKKGDVIARSGSQLHLEVLKNGQHLNPLYFAEGAKSGAAPGMAGGSDFPDYPGAPMSDSRYAALMEEAMKHLGKPYVFGAKGPDKFDCSGFVSWSLTHSGIKSISTNAQGLYNACTPVSRDNAQPGDLIFFTGTYSAGHPVTHVGIYIGNGMMLHAGKPVQYSSINTNYWKNHFYSFGRLSG